MPRRQALLADGFVGLLGLVADGFRDFGIRGCRGWWGLDVGVAGSFGLGSVGLGAAFLRFTRAREPLTLYLTVQKAH